MHTDTQLDALLSADPDALAWLVLLAYSCGHDAATRQTRIDIADARVAALIDGAAAAWRLRQRPARRITAEELALLPGCEPWPEETI
jgi:hypothetical protein